MIPVMKADRSMSPPTRDRRRVNCDFTYAFFILSPFIQGTTSNLFTHRQRDGLQLNKRPSFRTAWDASFEVGVHFPGEIWVFYNEALVRNLPQAGSASFSTNKSPGPVVK